MSNDPEMEIAQTGGDMDEVGGVLDSYRLHTDRINMLLGRWLEAVRVVTHPDDEIILDSLRHRLKMTLDDVTQENMLKIVSYSVASQFGDEHTPTDAS